MISVYRTGSVIKLFFRELNNLLSSAFLCEEHVLLTGDFNINMERSDSYSKELSEITSSYDLQLLSDKPTHIGGG